MSRGSDYVTIENLSEDGLKREGWRFWYYLGRLILDGYVEETRPSKRHGFKIKGMSYHRLERGAAQLEPKVPLPLDVQERAIAAFTKQLLVMKWTEARP